MSVPSASTMARAVVMTAASLFILKIAAPYMPQSIRNGIGI